MNIKDRIPTKPNRKLITPESGTAYYATVINADDPIEEGTTINKAFFDEVIPTSLPANGGNADTLGGKSAGDFLPIYSSGTRSSLYSNVASKYLTSGTSYGLIKITLPYTTQSTEYAQIDIGIGTAAATSHKTFTIGFAESGSGFSYVSAYTNCGTGKDAKIRLARNTLKNNRMCILIGDTTCGYYYPSVYIKQVCVGNSTRDWSSGAGYDIEIVTNETGLSDIANTYNPTNSGFEHDHLGTSRIINGAALISQKPSGITLSSDNCSYTYNKQTGLLSFNIGAGVYRTISSTSAFNLRISTSGITQAMTSQEYTVPVMVDGLAIPSGNETQVTAVVKYTEVSSNQMGLSVQFVKVYKENNILRYDNVNINNISNTASDATNFKFGGMIQLY